MDPRDTPGYSLHCALSNLTRNDVEQLDPVDRGRIDIAMTLLEQVNDPIKQDAAEETL